jgi:hypothetical protein
VQGWPGRPVWQIVTRRRPPYRAEGACGVSPVGVGAAAKRALVGKAGLAVPRVTLEERLCPRAAAREWAGEGKPEEAEHHT